MDCQNGFVDLVLVHDRLAIGLGFWIVFELRFKLRFNSNLLPFDLQIRLLVLENIFPTINKQKHQFLKIKINWSTN